MTASPGRRIGLLPKIIIAIVLGIVCGLFFPDWLTRVFVTVNGLFGNFLGFFVPVLIFALITPAIAGLGRGAGKWLAITTAIAYGSTIFSGLLAYGVAVVLGLPAMETTILVLFFALPTAPTAYVLTRQLGGDSHLMAGIITLQTLLAAASLPLVLTLLNG